MPKMSLGTQGAAPTRQTTMGKNIRNWYFTPERMAPSACLPSAAFHRFMTRGCTAMVIGMKSNENDRTITSYIEA